MSVPVTVVKVGGGKDIDHQGVFVDMKRYLELGLRFVVVHGAHDEMDELSRRLGKPPRTLISESGHESRYTDRETLNIFLMVYCGKVNKTLVALCHRLGINAVGLSGVDGALFGGERKKALRVVEGARRLVVRDDLSGKIHSVNVDLLGLLLDAGYVPLVCPPALSEEREPINVDGDRAAASLAVALEAERLVILSNVPGLLRDKNDPTSLIETISSERLDEEARYAEGRMKKKTLAAAEALRGGVKEVILADARVSRPIEQALQHRGTWIR
ncbi:MAG TPA: [LysW]-aminoadipate kinase [Vicinamibacteria bacterium]|nr:[LysW]-aminoadipate kinase [Vicinamibacteria bacterium]